MSIRVVCLSDFIFASSYELTDELDKFLRAADVVCVNFEAPIFSDDDRPVPKGINLHQLDDCSAFLRRYPVRVASLANNHITDFGTPALMRTIEFLNEHGVQTCGAGMDLDQALAPAQITVRDKKIGIWGFGWHFTEAIPAAPSRPGVAPLTKSALRRSIGSARRFDYQLAYMHYGIEYEDFPDPYQKHVSEKLVDEGLIDAVIGTHPHCVQGWEQSGLSGRRRAVYYSLGNFMLPQGPYGGKTLTFPPKSSQAYAAVLQLGEPSVFDIEHLEIDYVRETISIPSGATRNEMIDRVAWLSAPLPKRGVSYMLHYLRSRSRWHQPIPTHFELLNSAQVRVFRWVERSVESASRRLGWYELIRTALSRQVR